MANLQAYQPYAQNKGTLVPGQPIAVNKYTVQVERYLAQGGFAHVYLVTTATPVHNTTRHVLKRIAVANEAMLSEVKKEVDIMRILKGHPNIVHLIDAAWHKMPNGLFEVFILMEFCPGGGLIDMMNRRLRERLTEAEIFQIFVDVCEGVAAMHNLRPALLHRDLKVENILQSTPTSFKLCDFGSATSVAARPPATTQEIRALEADLNRHTTLQYRAPEMVDPYLRRPVDEKSDVWALGVLLYKLCYYTTPFEEHGPLAILNVQYRIPPYPVYSTQINSLISSILREHSTQRPSVFELLSTVHGLRGTKSPFNYTIPTTQSIPSRLPQPQAQIKPQSQRRQLQLPNDTLVPNSNSIKSPNAGVQAREKVLEAIAPMRRGRPSGPQASPSGPRSRQGSPHKPPDLRKARSQNTEGGSSPSPLNGFRLEDEKMGRVSASGKKDMKGAEGGKVEKNVDDAWDVKVSGVAGKDVGKVAHTFEDDFGSSIWASSSTPSNASNINPSKPSDPKRYRPPAFTGSEPVGSSAMAIPKVKIKDAFGDLGLNLGAQNQLPAPTLGEARKLRTGLATTSTSTPEGHNYNTTADNNKSGTPSSRPTPSPRPSYLSVSPSHFQTSSKSHSPSPSLPSSSWKPLSQSPMLGQSSLSPTEGLPVESRFPSFEELDASFARGQGSQASGERRFQPSENLLQPLASQSKLSSSGTGNLSRLISENTYSRDHGGVKSEHVTGVAMRDSSANKRTEESSKAPTQGQLSRPSLSRKHRSTLSMKQTSRPSVGPADLGNLNLDSGSRLQLPSTGIPVPRVPPRLELKDWLTGDDDGLSSFGASLGTSTSTSSEIPALRSSPSKPSSFIEKSPLREAAPLPKGDTVSSSQTALPVATMASTKSPTTVTATSRTSRIVPPAVKTVTQNQAQRPLKETWNSVAVPAKEPEKDSAAPATEPKIVVSASQKEPSLLLREPWSPLRPASKERDKDSSSDEGPEDVDGYIPPTPKGSKIRKREQARRTHKGRQSSVHDLVDLWGGAATVQSSHSGSGSNVDANTKGHTRRPTATGLPPSLTQPSSKAMPRSASPQPLKSAPADSRPMSRPTKLPIPGPEQHTKQISSASPTRSPVSARSRPQSMFLFPVSKASSDGITFGVSDNIVSPGLSPPEVPKPRAGIRRTSISDMVQRYEAIGGKASALVSPAALSRSAALRATQQQTEGNSYSKVQLGTSSSSPKGNDVADLRPGPLLTEPHSNLVSNKGRTSPTRAFNSSTARRSPVGRPNEPENAAQSSKVRPFQKTSISGGSSEVVDSHFPSRKSTTSAEESLKPSDEGSSSPEQSYQGVGKLIAQWQRKTAEADSSRAPVSPRRGGLATKRAALAGGADRGRQDRFS